MEPLRHRQEVDGIALGRQDEAPKAANNSAYAPPKAPEFSVPFVLLRGAAWRNMSLVVLVRVVVWGVVGWIW